MNNKKLLTLTVTAVVLVGLAYLSSTSKKMKAPSLVGKPVLKAFDLSELSRMETRLATNDSFVLESTADGWVISSLYNYPADMTKIRANLLKLKDLTVGHVASDKKLEDPILVDLQNASGKSLATLRLGKKHMRKATGQMAQFGGDQQYPDGRYVSADAKDTVVLVKETLEAFDGYAKNWIDTQITAVPATEVCAIELTQNSKPVKLTKKEGAWTLEGLTEQEIFDNAKSYSLESALNYLNFNSIADPALTDEQLGMTTGAVFQATLTSGERYTAKIGAALTNSTDRYFKIQAAFTPVGTNETQHAELAKKVETFNAKTGKWTYVISSYSAENMTVKREALIKAKEKEETSEKQTAEADQKAIQKD